MARFDFIARFYDRLTGDPTGDRIESLLAGAAEGGVLVDAGGGTGRVASRFVGHARSVLVLDMSPGMLRQARAKNGLAPVRADAAHLPLPTDSVDAALVVDALHHMDDADEAIRELFRVVKPGGRVVAEDFRMERWWVRLGIVATERAFFFGSRFDTPQGWARRFEHAGFRARVVPATWRDAHVVAVKPPMGGEG